MPTPRYCLYFATLIFLICRPQTDAWVMRRPLTRVRSASPTVWSSSVSQDGGVSPSPLAQTPTPSDNNPFGLTPELFKLSRAFESIGDDKLRYKQLLYMANQLAPMDPAQQIPENKVPGCLSTVHIDGQAVRQPDGTLVIEYTGDSDGLLTKGLVALLIRGLSGQTAAAIQLVQPGFIQQSGIAASLTPGRNNGFLNMLAVMKKKALQLEQEAQVVANKSSSNNTQASSDDHQSSRNSNHGDRPMYHAITRVLQEKLQPTVLQLTDVSYQHAGHAGARGTDGESHFDLTVVSEAFNGLNLVKRHQLIYQTLGDIMPRIHALSITAKTPAEVSNQ